MKMRICAAIFALMIIGAFETGAQQRTDEAPRPIGAERESSTGMVIDQSTLVRAGASDEPRIETGNVLLDSMDEGAASFREINSVLDETGTAKVFYDPEWRERFSDAGLRFELARDDLAMVFADERYEASLEAAIQAMDAGLLAMGTIRSAIDRDAPVFSRAKKELVAQESNFDAAFAQTRAVHRAEQAAEPAPPIDPIAAAQIIDVLCRSRGGVATAPYDACVAEQRAAVDTLTLRSGPSVGLLPNAFNTIRNNCRFELPNNFVEQDQCERQRIAAAGGR